MMGYIQKSLLVAIAFVFASLAVSCTQQQADPLRIMSYNIRYDNPQDGANAWDYRQERVANLVRFYEPDIIGTQEGLLHQLQYLDEQLETMNWIGIGRNDGDTEGEFTAIFYDSLKLELVSDSTIWLSETPAEPSQSWDAALPRILTFARFQTRNNGQEFYVFNTHFDHVGEMAREESTKLILLTINKVANGLPVIVTGDFNATPDSIPYLILNGVLNDTYKSSALDHVGPDFTYKGFAVNGDEEQERRIDYIFTNSEIEVLKHAIISSFYNGNFPSDHLPVIADWKFRQ